MTIRNLDAVFAPRSVAVVGASCREASVGKTVLDGIAAGQFTGRIYPVNPKYDGLSGLRCYRRLADLPEAPDLAVIVTPPATVPGLIAELGECGGKLAVVITAGITQDSGLRQRMLDAARPHQLRIVGPNTIGLQSPRASLNASFVPMLARKGGLGLVSQSGAIVSSLVDWAVAEGIGFSQVLSLGDMADVDMGDCINLLADDPSTSAILMYLESIPAPRKLISAARAAARVKPVIAVKPGRHAAAAQAAQTHTGALAGADIVVDAVLRRAGVIRVNDLEDLFTAAEITGRLRPLAKARVGIVTNGGGAGVLALDHMLDEACALADLHPSTLARLEKVLPATWSHANPVDIIGDAPAERYAGAVAAVADDPGVDALLVLNCPTALASPLEAAQAVARLAVDGMVNTKPLVTCWLGKQSAEPARRLLQQRGIASVDTPLQAARAIAFLTRWSTAQAMLRRVPAARPERFADIGVASAIFERVAGEGRTMLTEVESKSLLSAYGITVPQTRVAGSAQEVGRHADALLEHASALVVKVLSRDITHKSEIGGVELGIRSAEGAKRAADRISARVQRAGARMDGFTIQPMISRPGATELIAGLNTDPAFGPVILFGAGGTPVEVVADTALELLPIDEVLAGDLIGRTRVARLLAGYRNQPPADTAAIISVLLALSQLAIDWPAVTSIDINPLLADAEGVIALDARVAIDPARLAVRRPNPALVIRPYPADACRMETVGGLEVQVRPIRPEDAGLYPEFLKRVDRHDLRRRFLHHMATISPDALERLTQLDYDRDMAFVALDCGTGQLYGISRYASDPDHQRAEFGILVRSDMQRRGLGLMLMRRLIDFARADGLDRLEGSILRENAAALSLSRRVGFKMEAVAGEPSLVRACLHLRPGSEAASAADSDQGHQRTPI